MAEPVRKCAGCKLRVQGVRPWTDGHSYCTKCLARIEAQAKQQPSPALEAAPDPETIQEEPPVTTSAVTDQTAVEDEQDDLELDEPFEDDDEEAAEAPVAPAPVAAAAAGNPLGEVLVQERDNLRSQRESLIEELQRIELEIEAVDVRASHVDALLQPIGAPRL